MIRTDPRRADTTWAGLLRGHRRTAGEDIRQLHEETWADTPSGTRPPDFSLLDGRTVAVMEYDDVAHWLGGEIIATPDGVARHCPLWDRALDGAAPLRDHLAALHRMVASRRRRINQGAGGDGRRPSTSGTPGRGAPPAEAHGPRWTKSVRR